MTDDGLQLARRRRRIRAGVVLAVVAALVLGGLAYSLHYISRPSASSGPSTPGCTPAALPQAGFTLNVYNASGGSGSARSIAQRFAAGGFDVGSISNDPYKQKLTGVGQIRFGTKGKAAAQRYVRPLVPGAQLMPDGRDDTSVDVVLGDDFEADVPTAAPSKTC